MKRKLRETFQKLNLRLEAEQEYQFLRYYELLIEWNQKMNLTAITEYEEVLEKHFLDSLSIIDFIDLKEKNSLIDIGTGGGFPGIPLKIIFPNLKITLLDSLKKRITFLNKVIEELNLKDIKGIHGRAEDIAKRKEEREQYEVCVSRAVANLSTLSEYCLPFVKIGGSFIPYKSGNIEEEINNSKKALEILGGEIVKEKKFFLPDSDIKRMFLEIKKIKKTGNRYPRKAGLPTKEPLK